ncbi:MAG: tRNA preQ1(34) S-adenosylmethionine ribosyltransferase-isomerase QueA [Anaerolineales bacterium]|nr:tRNA preQ1(34) S-adenosylmethionine ribosyltransferase-isomerase QueA [Anaerolineales bacterium]
MRTSDFSYDLPSELIAQRPVRPRDRSRLLVLNRKSGDIEHSIFHQIGEYLNPHDVLVLNETRVIPARIHARKVPTGGAAEILLLKRLGVQTWEAMVGGKGLRPGQKLEILRGPSVEIIEDMGHSRRVVQFEAPISTQLDSIGEMPLPPYIHEPLEDPDEYQTIFAHSPGSSAAPTAGLHFTENLFEKLRVQGVEIAKIVLHVGLDTFAPVTEEDPHKHTIHTEWCSVTSEAADKINFASEEGGRIIAVGTTTVRTLETAAQSADTGYCVGSYEGSTDLFIIPGYHFRVVDAVITNFHLPRSTLLMMISAFADRSTILEVYQLAVQEQYRFYSFGDAMLIL